MSNVVEETLADMADDNSDETKGWDAGLKYAEGIRAEVQKELDTLRRLNYSKEYIDSWIDSADSVFFNLTVDLK
jgi:hypothetical protein